MAGQPPPLLSELGETCSAEGAEAGPALRPALTLPRLSQEAGAPMKSHLDPTVTGAKPFPSPGLSFPMSAVSKSALKVAMPMEISPSVN